MESLAISPGAGADQSLMRDFRRAVCALLVAGERVSALSKEVGVSEGTLYLWKRQALIDPGRSVGVKSFEEDDTVCRSPSRTNHPRPARVGRCSVLL